MVQEVPRESHRLLVNLFEAVRATIVRVLHHLASTDTVCELPAFAEVAKQTNVSNLGIGAVRSNCRIDMGAGALGAGLVIGLPLQRCDNRLARVQQFTKIRLVHGEKVVKGEEVLPCHFSSGMFVLGDFVTAQSGHGAGIGRLEAVVGGCAGRVDLSDGGVGSCQVSEYTFSHWGTA